MHASRHSAGTQVRPSGSSCDASYTRRVAAVGRGQRVPRSWACLGHVSGLVPLADTGLGVVVVGAALRVRQLLPHAGSSGGGGGGGGAVALRGAVALLRLLGVGVRSVRGSAISATVAGSRRAVGGSIGCTVPRRTVRLGVGCSGGVAAAVWGRTTVAASGGAVPAATTVLPISSWSICTSSEIGRCIGTERVTTGDDLLHCVCRRVHRVGLPADGDGHGVHTLVNLDVALELLLQSLDGLSSLANDAAHHALGALQHTRHAGAKLQDALLNDGLGAAGLALDELVDHLHSALHLVLLALHPDLAHLAFREILVDHDVGA
mmetsp:Transcript_18628/g.56251  ORF Transcript_18628/g.56251 Transcript_18628/m.56251 type:complete len:320 (+) Transcript_18628:969-1928(+)